METKSTFSPRKGNGGCVWGRRGPDSDSFILPLLCRLMHGCRIAGMGTARDQRVHHCSTGTDPNHGCRFLRVRTDPPVVEEGQIQKGVGALSRAGKKINATLCLPALNTAP